MEGKASEHRIRRRRRRDHGYGRKSDAVANNQLPDLAESHGFSRLKPNQVTLGWQNRRRRDGISPRRIRHGQAWKNVVLDERLFRYLERAASINRHGLDPLQFAFSRMDRKNNIARPLQTAHPAGFYGTQLTLGKDNILAFNDSAGALRRRKNHLSLQRPCDGPRQVWACVTDTLPTKRAVCRPNMGRMKICTTAGAGCRCRRTDGGSLSPGEKCVRQRFHVLVRPQKINWNESKYCSMNSVCTICFFSGRQNKLASGASEWRTMDNDLYIIDLKGKMIERLTDSPQDERDPKNSAMTGPKCITRRGDVGRLPIFKLTATFFQSTLKTNFVKEIYPNDRIELEPGKPIGNDKLDIRARSRRQRQLRIQSLHRGFKTGEKKRLTDFIGGGIAAALTIRKRTACFSSDSPAEKNTSSATWTFQMRPSRGASCPRHCHQSWCKVFHRNRQPDRGLQHDGGDSNGIKWNVRRRCGRRSAAQTLARARRHCCNGCTASNRHCSRSRVLWIPRQHGFIYSVCALSDIGRIGVADISGRLPTCWHHNCKNSCPLSATIMTLH